MDEGLLRRLRVAAHVLAGSAGAIGLIALTGWLLDLEVLRSVLPGRTAMNPLTALTFLACSATMLLPVVRPQASWVRVSKVLGASVLLVGLVTLIGYATGENVGLDQVLFGDQLNGNRVAPNTGFAFFLLGMALVFLDHGRGSRMRASEGLALIVLLLALNAVLGYVYEAGALYGWAQFIPMALPTAIAFVALSLAILFLRPQQGVMSLIVSETIGGRLARRLLPATCIGVAIIGYLRLLGQRAGWYDVGFGIALFVVVVVLLLGTLILFTARSLTRVELVQRETDQVHARLAAIVENADDAIVGKTVDGIVTSWNRGAERLYQYTAEEMVGNSIRILTPPGHPDDESAVLARVINGEVVRHFQTRRRRKDGEVLEVSLTVSPVRDKLGRVVAASGIARDITSEKRAEAELRRARAEAEMAVRAKSAFLANMSHEIRTPMNAIIGMTGLLQDTKLSDEQRDYAETIRLSGEHLLSIINDILDFSKIESGHLQLERHAFHLMDCIEEAIELVAAGARNKGLELAYSVEPSVPLWWLGDVGRVRQILVNLLSNGVKFTEEGGVTVNASSRPLDAGMTELEFQVRDTGIGIAQDKQGLLFQSFSQADVSMSRRYGGTGLGLAISKQLVELMGGRIGVQSEPGQGSTFTFTLHLETAPAPEEADVGPLRELQGVKILIVDDNITNRRLLNVLAERWGMVARVASAPDEALLWLEGKDPFDVAVFDYHMPGMDGVTLADRARQIPHRSSLPIVLLSSIGTAADVGPRARTKFARILQKPARQSQLRDAILAAINPDHVRRTRRPAAEPAQGMQSLRVLLVEDNPTNQLVAGKMLRKMGVEPVIVNNGQEALEAVDREHYDLVFMDVQMPVLDGLEATRRICAKYPRKHRPWIVAMTAEAMHGDRERCLEAGMDDYITKPVRASELERVLKAVGPGSQGR